MFVPQVVHLTIGLGSWMILMKIIGYGTNLMLHIATKNGTQVLYAKIALYVFVLSTFSKQALNESWDICNRSLPHERHICVSCQAHFLAQYDLNIESIRQKWHCCCDWREPHLIRTRKTNLFFCFFGCPRSHCLFPHSVLHFNRTVNTIT